MLSTVVMVVAFYGAVVLIMLAVLAVTGAGDGVTVWEEGAEVLREWWGGLRELASRFRLPRRG